MRTVQIPLWTIVTKFQAHNIVLDQMVQIPLWTIVTRSAAAVLPYLRVQIPLWTIVTRRRAVKDSYSACSDSSMDDCNGCAL